MSHTFIPRFFPDLLRHSILKLGPNALCEDPGRLKLLGHTSIQWPMLLPLCLCGVLTGLGGALMLYKSRNKGSSVHASWVAAFLFFGLMNITAAMSHCLLTDLNTRASTVWRALDVGCTGAASVSCMHAAASAVRQALKGAKLPQRRKNSTAAIVLGLNLGLIGLPVLGNLFRVPWTNELIYLALSLMCVPLVALDLVVAWSSARRAARFWMMVAVMGLLVCGIGQPLESLLCELSGSHINAVHGLFAGCDIIFLGLAGYLQSHHRTAQQALKQE